MGNRGSRRRGRIYHLHPVYALTRLQGGGLGTATKRKKAEFAQLPIRKLRSFIRLAASDIASQWYSAYAEWYSLREFYGE